eukprot:2707401-Rhodomonas_salina.1
MGAPRWNWISAMPQNDSGRATIRSPVITPIIASTATSTPSQAQSHHQRSTSSASDHDSSRPTACD